MKVYCDITEEPGCIGIIPNPGVEVIFTGVELHTEPAKFRGHPMAVRLAEECDLHFRFGDEHPPKPFYTVPKTTVFAHDSRGGWFVTTEDAGLDWSSPLYYIDPAFVCHRIRPTGKIVADMGKSWRENMIPCGDIEVFSNRAAAEERYPILTLQQLLDTK